MIHRKASTLQFHKVQGSKLFTGFSGSRQGSKALRLQEAKFGVPPFHDPRATYFQHSKFPGSKIPWTKGSILRVPKFKVSGKAWGFPVQVPDLQKLESSRVLEVQGCRILRLQGSKVQRLQVTRLQESKVAGFHGFKAPRFQSSGLTGFQSRNPLLETLQEFLAESFAVTFPDASTKLADLVWVLFY